jgi:hypothetical protein
MTVDFLASQSQYIDHMLPIWKELPDEYRGQFQVTASLFGYLAERGFHPEPIDRRDRRNCPVLVSALSDLSKVVSSRRKIVFMEHGIGITPSRGAGYAGGGGPRDHVDMFLAPNEYIRTKTAAKRPGVAQVVIGTPKMDYLAKKPQVQQGNPPTVAISFHWDGSGLSPEAGNAFDHYKSTLPFLNKCSFYLLGHAHPRIFGTMESNFSRMGIASEPDFDKVMDIADLYIVDTSSTLYEFCLTGKPVIILNCPAYRKDVSWGIRFWEYTDIGPQVEKPVDLRATIEMMLENGGELYKPARDKMIADLYPHFGNSAKIAAQALIDFAK